jgi:hypothetical protein
MNEENAWAAPVGDGLVTFSEPVALVQGRGCVLDTVAPPGEILSDNESLSSIYVDVSRSHAAASPGTGGIAMSPVPRE